MAEINVVADDTNIKAAPSQDESVSGVDYGTPVGYRYRIYRVTYADPRRRSQPATSTVLFRTRGRADAFAERYHTRGMFAKVDPIDVSHSEFARLRNSRMLDNHHKEEQ